MTRIPLVLAISAFAGVSACASSATRPPPRQQTPSATQQESSTENNGPSRGPSTAQERAWAVKLAGELERDPLRPELESERRKLLIWLAQVPDIKVLICADYIAPGLREKDHVSAILVAQQMFAQAAFNIDNPSKANSREAQLAGVEGVLRTYSVIVSSERRARNAHFEKLLGLEREGKLGDFVDSTLQHCKI